VRFRPIWHLANLAKPFHDDDDCVTRTRTLRLGTPRAQGWGRLVVSSAHSLAEPRLGRLGSTQAEAQVVRRRLRFGDLEPAFGMAVTGRHDDDHSIAGSGSGCPGEGPTRSGYPGKPQAVSTPVSSGGFAAMRCSAVQSPYPRWPPPCPPWLLSNLKSAPARRWRKRRISPRPDHAIHRRTRLTMLFLKLSFRSIGRYLSK